MTAEQIDLRLRPNADAPALARRAAMSIGCDVPSMDRLALLVSELVTNAVRHAALAPDAEIRVRAEARADTAHVCVCDPGGGPFAVAQDAPADDAGGMGLLI